MSDNKTTDSVKDGFQSRRGFILACIGSAVGMGNIWMFPSRISAYGGGTFLIPYILFVFLIGSTGVIGEMALGRASRSGPVGSFGLATYRRFGNRIPGRIIGSFPILSSLAMAIGYSVVVGWIVKYMIGAFSGEILKHETVDEFSAYFGQTASAWGNNLWLIIAVVATCFIIVFGIGSGIEKANRIMMPLFFLLFIVLAVYISTLPGASDGYHYIFRLKPEGLLDPMVWVFALGQAFFSLSVAGNGTLIYGSYLDESEDIPNSAKYVALFDTLAAIISSLVIIPAMATAGQQLDMGGPGLMFIFLPHIFKQMPGGSVIMVIFFVAVFMAGMSSLINLYECSVSLLQRQFHKSRVVSGVLVCGLGLAVALCIQGIVSGWMDVCSVYFCPIGAGLAGIMFFWICDREFCLEQVNLSRTKALGGWFYPLAKYGFCGGTILVLVLGSILGGIG